MAIITKIEIQKNNKQKVNLYLNDEYYNRVYLDTCVKYGLKVGKEIDEDALTQIIRESEIKLAINFAINYIGSALKTKKQIKDYLVKKEFDSEIISAVIDKLIEYKFVNDEQFVQSYINSYISKYGKNRLIQNLKTKGISEKLINNYLEDNQEELSEKTEDTCINIARKKAKNYDMSDVKNQQKLYRFLVSRGFSFEEINNSINLIKKEKM